MNKVYLSGIIAREPLYRVETGNIPHLILHLGIRYATKSGTVNRESYRVSAWNEAAQWGMNNLKTGQIIVVHGHLVRRKRKDGVTLTEIVADEIVPARQTSFVPVVASPNNDSPADNSEPPAMTYDA